MVFRGSSQGEAMAEYVPRLLKGKRLYWHVRVTFYKLNNFMSFYVASTEFFLCVCEES
jgi:hypothetical protein